MPQHIWKLYGGRRRICGACDVVQTKTGTGSWVPKAKDICPGDGRDSSRRERPKPNADGPRILEDA